MNGFFAFYQNPWDLDFSCGVTLSTELCRQNSIRHKFVPLGTNLCPGTKEAQIICASGTTQAQITHTSHKNLAMANHSIKLGCCCQRRKATINHIRRAAEERMRR